MCGGPGAKGLFFKVRKEELKPVSVDHDLILNSFLDVLACIWYNRMRKASYTDRPRAELPGATQLEALPRISLFWHVLLCAFCCLLFVFTHQPITKLQQGFSTEGSDQ